MKTKKRTIEQSHFANGQPVAPPTLRLNLGSGPTKMDGFLSVDAIAFPGVDVVTDLRERWPWDDATVTEVHASHFLEHLTGRERVHFCNELYRILIPGGKCTLIVPHWCSNRAYGDFTHQWPPVSEMWFYYLNREWRLGSPEKGAPANAPHTDKTHNPDGYDCDFEATWGYSFHSLLGVRNQDYQQHALQFWKEAAQDTIATLTKRV